MYLSILVEKLCFDFQIFAMTSKLIALKFSARLIERCVMKRVNMHLLAVWPDKILHKPSIFTSIKPIYIHNLYLKDQAQETLKKPSTFKLFEPVYGTFNVTWRLTYAY